MTKCHFVKAFTVSDVTDFEDAWIYCIFRCLSRLNKTDPNTEQVKGLSTLEFKFPATEEKKEKNERFAHTHGSPSNICDYFSEIYTDLLAKQLLCLFRLILSFTNTSYTDWSRFESLKRAFVAGVQTAWIHDSHQSKARRGLTSFQTTGKSKTKELFEWDTVSFQLYRKASWIWN